MRPRPAPKPQPSHDSQRIDLARVREERDRRLDEVRRIRRECADERTWRLALSRERRRG